MLCVFLSLLLLPFSDGQCASGQVPYLPCDDGQLPAHGGCALVVCDLDLVCKWFPHPDDTMCTPANPYDAQVRLCFVCGRGLAQIGSWLSLARFAASLCACADEPMFCLRLCARSAKCQLARQGQSVVCARRERANEPSVAAHDARRPLSQKKYQTVFSTERSFCGTRMKPAGTPW